MKVKWPKTMMESFPKDSFTKGFGRWIPWEGDLIEVAEDGKSATYSFPYKGGQKIFTYFPLSEED